MHGIGRHVSGIRARGRMHLLPHGGAWPRTFNQPVNQDQAGASPGTRRTPHYLMPAAKPIQANSNIDNPAHASSHEIKAALGPAGRRRSRALATKTTMTMYTAVPKARLPRRKWFGFRARTSAIAPPMTHAPATIEARPPTKVMIRRRCSSRLISQRGRSTAYGADACLIGAGGCSLSSSMTILFPLALGFPRFPRSRRRSSTRTRVTRPRFRLPRCRPGPRRRAR